MFAQKRKKKVRTFTSGPLVCYWCKQLKGANIWHQWLWKCYIRDVLLRKSSCSFKLFPKSWEAGRPLPNFYGTFSRSSFMVYKRSLFLTKCQEFKLLTVLGCMYMVCIVLLILNDFQILNFFVRKKVLQVDRIGWWGR